MKCSAVYWHKLSVLFYTVVSSTSGEASAAYFALYYTNLHQLTPTYIAAFCIRQLFDGLRCLPEFSRQRTIFRVDTVYFEKFQVRL